MANEEHLEILKRGVEIWNQWRSEHPKILPDLREANLTKANLSGADLGSAILNGANLSGANLGGADLTWAILNKANLSEAYLLEAHLAANFGEANLSGAYLNEAYLVGAYFGRTNFREANLYRAHLVGVNLREAILHDTNLREANLSEADLNGADLIGADLSKAILIGTHLTNATLKDCRIYGISVWDAQLDGSKQQNLIITPAEQPTITVDNLKVAQFIYLLLNNAEIREVIDTITSKVVLILGRFTSERKIVLDSLREELRNYNYLPVLFDFDKPAGRDLTETVSTLAHLARFIIVDLTDPSSAPHEVATVIPNTVVPVQPLILHEPLLVDGKILERHEYAMFQDLRRRYNWVLPTYHYTDQAHLIATLKDQVIEPAERKAQELAQR